MTKTKPPFKTGERIKINTVRSKYNGMEGKVTSFSDTYNEVRIILDDGTYTTLHPNSLAKLIMSTPVPSSNKNIAYLRVSTPDQDTTKNKADVLTFANDRHFGHIDFVEEVVSGKKSWKERNLAGIIDTLVDGDRLITPELTRLGRSTLEVLEILKAAKEKGIAVYAVKEKMELNGDDVQSKVMTTMLSLFAELERDFISMRTKEALKAKKAAGVKLGRPKGPGKSKLDPNRDEIVALLKTGVPKTKVAEKYSVNRMTLQNWLKKNDIEVKNPV